MVDINIASSWQSIFIGKEIFRSYSDANMTRYEAWDVLTFILLSTEPKISEYFLLNHRLICRFQTKIKKFRTRCAHVIYNLSI